MIELGDLMSVKWFFGYDSGARVDLNGSLQKKAQFKKIVGIFLKNFLCGACLCRRGN